MHQASAARTLAVLIACVVVGMDAAGQVQSVVSTAGNFFSNAAGSIAFTIGEPVIATQTTGSVIITQGFHQPDDDIITVTPAVVPAPGITVLPDPSHDDVFVTLAYAEFIVPLVKAMQELNARNEALAAANLLLMDRLANHEMALAEVRTELDRLAAMPNAAR